MELRFVLNTSAIYKQVDQGLKEFREKMELSSAWVQGGIQRLDSKELSRMPSNEMTEQIDSLAAEKKQQEKTLNDLRDLADHLIKDPRTGTELHFKDTMELPMCNLVAYFVLCCIVMYSVLCDFSI